MKKLEFLSDLQMELKRRVPRPEAEKALLYYGELIDDEVELGRTEEEAVRKLPLPSHIAMSIADGINNPDKVVASEGDIPGIIGKIFDRDGYTGGAESGAYARSGYAGGVQGGAYARGDGRQERKAEHRQEKEDRRCTKADRKREKNRRKRERQWEKDQNKQRREKPRSWADVSDSAERRQDGAAAFDREGTAAFGQGGQNAGYNGQADRPIREEAFEGRDERRCGNSRYDNWNGYFRRRHGSVMGTVFKFIGLFFFCIICVPVFMGLMAGAFGAIAGLWAGAVAITASGCAVPIYGVIIGIMGSSAAIALAYCAAGLLLLPLGLLSIKGLLIITKLVIKALIKFFKFFFSAFKA